MTMPPAEQIDVAEVYTLIKGVTVISRPEGIVQIGSEPPAAVLLHHPPPHANSILRGLDGTVPLLAVLIRHRADVSTWTALLADLRDARLLIPVARVPGAQPGRPMAESERDSLVQRHGMAAARVALQARHDAVVVVRGSGRTATAIATALLVSGVGHVHQQPDRVPRLAELPDQAPGREDLPWRSPPGSADPKAEYAGPGLSGQAAPGSAVKAAAALLATHLRRVAPGARVHAPPAHLRVALTVLAGDGPPSPSLAAELTDHRLPHLAVRAGLITAVVGPLVLPGRSSCLLCALRHRTELDGGRAEVEQSMRCEVVMPPAQLVAAASVLAVNEVLDHLDGITVPTTVDGTVEWQLGAVGPRRRSWSRHPDCGCRRDHAPLHPVKRSEAWPR